jgi:hypothetical protein
MADGRLGQGKAKEVDVAKKFADLDQLTQKILRLWEENKSASQIGQELGVTKNVVIGRVTRARMSGVKLTRAIGIRRGVPSPKPLVVKNRRIIREFKLRCEPLPVLEMITPEQIKKSIPLSQLTSRSCRYILNDDRSHPIYCGAQKEKKSYCCKHYALCYYALSAGPRKKAPKKKWGIEFGVRGGIIRSDG